MSTLRVASITVEALPGGNQNSFGIEQTQNFAPGQVVPGQFVADVYNADRTTFIVRDTDNGLAPEGGGTPMSMVSSIMPNTSIQVFSYYEENGGSPTSEQWTEVPLPSGGWGGKMIHLHWVEA